MSTPAGLSYIPDFVSSEEESALLASIYAEPWLSYLRRRVQHYGYRYDYRARRVERDLYLGPLPQWSEAVVERLLTRQVFPERPVQLIVNEYEPGQGISPHIDCVPCFGPVVASLSLGSGIQMEVARGDEVRTIWLHSRSLLVLSQEARYQWTHAIRPRRTDADGTVRVPRGRRVSLTFRTVLA